AAIPAGLPGLRADDPDLELRVPDPHHRHSARLIMRISTTTFQNDAVAQMDALQVAMARTQQDLSTGLKVRTASDDPTGMAQVNQMNVEVSASVQYVTNSNTAQTNLQLEEQAMTDASNVIQNVNSLAVEANNSALTP